MGNHRHYETFLKCLELGARLTAHSIHCLFSFPPLNFYLEKNNYQIFWFTPHAYLIWQVISDNSSQSFPTTFPCTPHEKGFYLSPALRNLLNKLSFRSQEQKEM